MSDAAIAQAVYLGTLDAHTRIRDLEAEVERLHEYGAELNSELLDVRIKHVGEKDELRREVERLREALRDIRKVSRSNHLPLGMTIRTLAHTVHRMADKALKARAAMAGEGDT